MKQSCYTVSRIFSILKVTEADILTGRVKLKSLQILGNL